MRLLQVLSARNLPLRWPGARRAAILIGLVAAAVVPLDSDALLLQNTAPNTPRNIPEFINRQPDFSDQERMREEQKSQQNFAAMNALRKKQVSDDSAKLLKLANDIQAEVAKSDRDTVSQSTLRKAEEIEKLARNIKQKMSVSVLPN
jgi:hypothetical protein